MSNPERYEIYEVTQPLFLGKREWILTQTTGSPGGIGTALVTHRQDQLEADIRTPPVMAIYDSDERIWITGPVDPDNPGEDHGPLAF